jgi:iron complex outermembrane recepter protein
VRVRGASAATRRLWSCSVLPLVLAHPTAALAQTSNAPAVGEDIPQAMQPTPGELRPVPTAQPPADVPIVITGSRIPRRNLTAVSPITVIQQDEVKLQGTVAIEELLNRLPQVRPGQGLFVPNDATGTAEVDLRGLGPARTLVLINGRRVMPGDSTVPDINMVPSTLIQRIEVLTGGAAAVYGSDAVAGVVNFILDTHLEGLRIDAQTSVFQHDNDLGTPWKDLLIEAGVQFPTGSVADGRRQDINVALGRSFLDNRAHVTVYAGYRKIKGVTEDRRDYSACAFGIQDDHHPEIIQCAGSIVSYPGTFSTFFESFTIGPDRTFVPGVGLFNFAPFNFFQRPDRRYIAGGFADFEISGAVHPYAEVMFMDDRSLAQVAPAGDFENTQTINCDNPLLSDQQKSLVCAEGNFVGEEGGGAPVPFIDPVTGATYHRAFLFIARRNVEGGPRQEDLRHKNRRLVGGVKGDLGRGFSYDASYISGRVTTRKDDFNFVSVTRMRRAIDVITDPATGQPACRSRLTGEDPACVPWDIFALDGVTPEATAYIELSASRRATITERVANANSTVDLGSWGLRSPWADESPQINFGAEYRKDRLEFEPDEATQSGDIAGSDRVFPVRGSVDVKELFVEARIPLVTRGLVERLAFEGGYRQSWYRNPESGFTTNAYKVALDLTVVRGLRLRASRQRAVRAPNIVELFTPIEQFEFDTDDPCAGTSPQATAEQCARTGVTAAQYGHILLSPNPEVRGYHVTIGGNPELRPEKATTRTVGLVLQPQFLRGFNATLDWWGIDLKGAIGAVGPRTTLFTCLETGDPLFCDRIHRDSTGSLWLTPEGFIDNRLINIGARQLRGLDIGVNYVRNLGRFGFANFALVGSRMLKYEFDPGGLAAPGSCVGLYGTPCGTPLPRWRHTARMTWNSKSEISLSLYWRHIGAVRAAAAKLGLDLLGPISPGDLKIGAQDYFDLTSMFHVGRKYELRLGVSNLFDRRPPVIGGSSNTVAGEGVNGNTFAGLYDPLGRQLFAGITMNF